MEKKVWFKWPNGQLERVYIYKEYESKGETCYRAKRRNKVFELKNSLYGHSWAFTKDELERKN